MPCSTEPPQPFRRPHVKLRIIPVSLPADGVWIDGHLFHAPDVRGLAAVLYAGKTLPPRTEALIAEILHQAGFATLTLNLLTSHETSHNADACYNVAQLASRLLAAAEWTAHQPPLSSLPLGLVSLGTASAGAIRAAVKEPERFSALVCLGGRPDLAGAGPLRALALPARFAVGRGDPESPILRQAYALLTGKHDWKQTEAVGMDTEEAASACARLAAAWLAEHLRAPVQGLHPV